MKQTLLTICLILFALPSWGDNLVCKYIGFNCPEIDNWKDLYELDGLYYKRFTDASEVNELFDLIRCCAGILN